MLVRGYRVLSGFRPYITYPAVKCGTSSLCAQLSREKKYVWKTMSNKTVFGFTFLFTVRTRVSVPCIFSLVVTFLCGDGFGNHSYLMVHLLTLATGWFDFQQQRFFLFSIYLQTEDAFFICAVNAPTIGTWLILRTKKLLEEAPPNIQISVFSANHKLTRE